MRKAEFHFDGTPALAGDCATGLTAAITRKEITLLSATNPMTYTRPNKQKLRGLHLAALEKAVACSFTPSSTRNVMASSFF